MKNRAINKFNKVYYKLKKKVSEPITTEAIRISYKRKHLTELQSELFEHFIESNLNMLCCDGWETGASYVVLLSNKEDNKYNELATLFEYINGLKLKVKLEPIFNLFNGIK